MEVISFLFTSFFVWHSIFNVYCLKATHIVEFGREWLFFFSALGAFNGLILSFYVFFFARPKHISNYFLGGLLLSLSLRIGKSVIFHFNPELADVYLQIGLVGCFFIGPFLYFYLRSVVDGENWTPKLWRMHLVFLIPALAIHLYLYNSQVVAMSWALFINAIYVIWAIYVIAAAKPVKDILRKTFRKEQKLSFHEIWLISIYIGNFIIWLVFLSFPYVSYITGALSFSLVLYFLVLMVLLNRKGAVFYKSGVRYGNRKIANEKASQLEMDLKALMERERLFQNPNLTMPLVAGKLNISNHQLSQLLNDNLGKPFPTFVNEYRIDEAKKLLADKPQFSLEAIGYECGFNSRSTFYATFKKLTGTTPAQYQNKLLGKS